MNPCLAPSILASLGPKGKVWRGRGSRENWENALVTYGGAAQSKLALTQSEAVAPLKAGADSSSSPEQARKPWKFWFCQEVGTGLLSC